MADVSNRGSVISRWSNARRFEIGAVVPDSEVGLWSDEYGGRQLHTGERVTAERVWAESPLESMLDETLGDLVPGLGDLSGKPDWRVMPGVFAHTIGRRLPDSWRAVAALTISDLLDMHAVGVGKVNAFLDYVSDLVEDSDTVGWHPTSYRPRVRTNRTLELMRRVTIAELVPGVTSLPGEASWKSAPSTFANTLGARLPRDWGEVGALRIGDLLRMPGVGHRKVNAFLDYLEEVVTQAAGDLTDADAGAQTSSSLEMSARIESAVTRVNRLLPSIALSGVVSGASTMAEALAAALSDPIQRSRLDEISLPTLTPDDWFEDVRAIRSQLDDRERRILDGRVFVASRSARRTLEELGGELGITRERVRQLEVSALEKVRAIAGHPDWLGIQHAGHVFSTHGAAFPIAELGVDADVEFLTLVALLDDYRIDGDWIVGRGFRKVSDLAESTFEDLAEDGLVEADAFTDALSEMGVDPRYHDDVSLTLSLERIDGFLVKRARAAGDRAVQRLRVAGRPMTIGELAVGEQNVRSFANAVRAHDSIVRVGKDRYALEEWGGTPYRGIVEEMIRRLAHGKIESIAALAAEFESEYGVSRNSVSMYATMDPRFVSEAGYVRLRRSDEPYESTARLEDAKDCFMIGGDWALRLEVDHDLLRGSGRPIPEAFGVHIGCRLGETGVLRGPLGDIRIGWSMQTTIGSLRREARHLGLEEGDHLYVIRDGNSRLRFAGVKARDGRWVYLEHETSTARSLGASE